MRGRPSELGPAGRGAPRWASGRGGRGRGRVSVGLLAFWFALPGVTARAAERDLPLCLHSGDIDGLNGVSAADAQTAFYIALGVIAPTPMQECLADCNGDGVVSSGDAQRIFLAALGVSTCPVDAPAGEICALDVHCASGHCDNSICCAAGDCCREVADCPAGYAAPAVCEVEATCQGSRLDAVCADYACASVPVADDSACGPDIMAADCGYYPDVTCLGLPEQTPRGCATSCAQTSDCGSGGYCCSGECLCAPSAFFTGPGLQLFLDNAALDLDGTVTTSFRLTDGAGLALDRAGHFTEGAVTVRFVLSRIDEDPTGGVADRYTYTTRFVTSPISGDSADQPAFDEGGTFTDVCSGEGEYAYQFGTVAIPPSRDLTHTVTAVAERTFAGRVYRATARLDFVPDASPVVTTREVVTAAACDTCHGRLQGHADELRDLSLCLGCHTPQAVDPDTGNDAGFRVMIHKIHRGGDLPSVLAGTPYRLIDEDGAVHDWSTVAYPRSILGCTTCHGGPQGDFWNLRPARAACGSCHDLTAFEDPPSAGMTLHPGGAQGDDQNCAVCHPPTGGLAGIRDRHVDPLENPTAIDVEFAIQSVASTGPGQTPQVAFQVLVDGAPRNILTSPLTRLAVTVAGPTTDYTTYWQHTIQGSGATGTLTAIDPAQGLFLYTCPAPMPAGATGSYAFALEGYLQPGGSTGPRYAADPPIAFAAVTDATPVARRAVVADDACNACHGRLVAHSGIRARANYCTLCHNSTKANDQRVSRYEVPLTFAPSVDFKVMIHKIHRGSDLVAQPYVLGGSPTPTKANPAGTPIDFGATRYPGDLRTCDACHVAGAVELPLAAEVLPATEFWLACTEDPASDTDNYCDLRTVSETVSLPPTGAVCTACHDGPWTVAHAETMTSGDGVESCTTCHQAGSAFGIDQAHALDP